LVRPPTEFDSAYWAFRRLILNIILMDATILLRGVDRFLTNFICVQSAHEASYYAPFNPGTDSNEKHRQSDLKTSIE